ncbi:hypothetical protein NQZ79_g3574 [Umbelopsis isabellina]|nr:hypothetical protein NQZ79_g3574 [Umbelopsis isabellina]
MVREAEPSLNEKQFVLRALKDGLRTDGRRPYDFRSIQISFLSEYGHVQIQLGRTRVSAKVTAEVVRPRPDKPTEGLLLFNTEISPMASPAFEIGRPSEEEVLISRTIEKALRRSRAVDTEGLCIVAGEKVTLVSMMRANNKNCASIAAITALLHFRRPDVTVIGEEVTIHPMDQRNPVPLSVHHIPICVSFSFFAGGELLVVDPSIIEEQIREGDMTIAMNIHKEICALSKAGGIPLEMDQIIRCSKIATTKTAEITELIQKALADDKAQRQSK